MIHRGSPPPIVAKAIEDDEDEAGDELVNCTLCAEVGTRRSMSKKWPMTPVCEDCARKLTSYMGD